MRHSDTSRAGKRSRAKADPDSMRPEYDFSKGVRGATSRRFAEGTNIVVLDADIAGHFPDSASVNRALRLLVEIAAQPTAKPRRAPSRSRSRRP
jgi:hypothetical protein